MPQTDLNQLNNDFMLERLEKARLKARGKIAWPERHIVGLDNQPVPFHEAQNLCWDSNKRIVALVGGSQLGKTTYAPFWLKREIELRGSGDYLAVTSSYDLFRLKLLPSLLNVFQEIFQLGRYWTGDKVFELKNPLTGKYEASKATDKMWGRIILRSAQSLGGLESATAKGALLDEAGQEEFTIEAWRAILRRLALNSGRLLITTTLYDPNWVDTEIVSKALEGGKTRNIALDNGGVIDCTENDKTAITLVQADSIANPTFPLEEYEKAKRDLPFDVFARFYRGRTARPRFMIYDCFDEDLNLIDPFPLPPEWPRYVGLDFGAVNTVATFWAEEPVTGRLICYREYKAGGRSAKEHIESLLKDEPMRPIAYGGAKAEGQWRLEFKEAGLPVREPKISDVWLGINKVYSCFKNKEIAILKNVVRELPKEIMDYRRKTDKMGNPTDDILNKEHYHRLDSLRYIVPSVKRDRKVQVVLA